ncbi:hypothetical protein [Aureivirga sp. CE67]|uniref:hypothetical protein n=1 Tax=Aureivirga sp. CE67 TaxID=1788983 RepID=UPI0018CB1E45|nr:hypothetical protein [Aureivirga sp. CE67]
MIKKFEVDTTEGVLVLASKKRLKDYYTDRNFDYGYPEGLLDAINKGIILPITTESQDFILTNFIFDETDINGLEIGQCKLFLEENDTLQIMNFVDFTMICDYNSGDIDAYDFYFEEQYIKELKKGWYIINIYVNQYCELEHESDIIEISFKCNWLAEDPTFIKHTDVYVV